MMANQQQQSVISSESIIYHKDSIIKLQQYIDKKIRVLCTGGRTFVGVLKGFDIQNNMILDDTIEILRGNINIQDLKDANILTEQTRKLGLLVTRGNLLQTIATEDGYEEIENPYL